MAVQRLVWLGLMNHSFLNLDMEMRDHDWSPSAPLSAVELNHSIRLLKQPDTLLLPPLDADVDFSATSQTKCSNGGDEGEIPLKTEVNVSESSSTLASVECCTTVSRKPSPSDRRSTTPTTRNPAKSCPRIVDRIISPTPTSRAAFLPSSKPAAAAQARSSTPVRPTSHSSTPASRPSLPVVSKPRTRSATPTRKPATQSPVSSLDRSSSGKKIGAPVLKSSVMPSRGASLSSSQDAAQNPKKVASMPRRPVSASRARLGSNSSSSSNSNKKVWQKSFSPARARPPVSKVVSRSRGYSNGGDDEVNPVVMGTKMANRVVNRSSQASSTASACGIQSGCAKISTAAALESPQTTNTDSSKSSSSRSSYFLNGAEMDE